MEINGLQVRRSAFINELCATCSGKITRFLLGSQGLADENGGEIFQTQVMDCCECDEPPAFSTVVSWPCRTLDALFDQWIAGKITRAEFDQKLFTTLRSANSEWHTKAS